VAGSLHLLTELWSTKQRTRGRRRGKGRRRREKENPVFVEYMCFSTRAVQESSNSN